MRCIFVALMLSACGDGKADVGSPQDASESDGRPTDVAVDAPPQFRSAMFQVQLCSCPTCTGGEISCPYMHVALDSTPPLDATFLARYISSGAPLKIDGLVFSSPAAIHLEGVYVEQWGTGTRPVDVALIAPSYDTGQSVTGSLHVPWSVVYTLAFRIDTITQ